MDIAELKELAQAATPGPWVAKDAPGAGLEIYADVPSQLGMASREWPAFSTANADCKNALVAYETWTQFPGEKLKNVQARNAVFIAAANPSAVLELLASHDQLVAALDDAILRLRSAYGLLKCDDEFIEREVSIARAALAAAGA